MGDRKLNILSNKCNISKWISNLHLQFDHHAIIEALSLIIIIIRKKLEKKKKRIEKSKEKRKGKIR